jgi:D-alanine-D-alanine ligase
MDKEFTKKILKSAGIPLIKSVCPESENELGELDLTYPLMVKPAGEGSSIGMTKVNDPSELLDAWQLAKKSDKKVLIEEFLKGADCTVGVLEDNDGNTFATPILELRPKNEWYDYEAKYTAGMTEFILPAEFSEALTKKVQEIAVAAHLACECSGVSRVDFLVKGEEPYVLEINTSPGMTDLSDLPAQAGAMGIDYKALVQMILNTAGLNK